MLTADQLVQCRFNCILVKDIRRDVIVNTFRFKLDTDFFTRLLNVKTGFPFPGRRFIVSISMVGTGNCHSINLSLIPTTSCCIYRKH